MVNVFGSAAPAAVPFSEPAAGDGPDFVLSEHVGATLILTVEGITEVETKMYGVKPAAKVSRVVSLDTGARPAAPVVYEDVLIFQSAPVSQLRKSAGQTVIASVEEYESKYKKTALKLAPPSAAGVKAAEAWLAESDKAPF